MPQMYDGAIKFEKSHYGTDMESWKYIFCNHDMETFHAKLALGKGSTGEIPSQRLSDS